MKNRLHFRIAAALPATLWLAGCGGGGGPAEAVVTSVSPAAVLRSTSATTLNFTIQLNKAVVNGVTLAYTTSSTSKAGASSNSLGSAIGGTSCGAGVDYVATTSATAVSIPAGVSTYPLSIPVCGVSSFQPNLTLNLNWTSGTAGGTVMGTIVNTEPGGIASTGALTQIDGLTAFGRDTDPLTDSNADGQAGLSYTQLPSAASWQCTRDNVTGLTWEVKADASALNATYTTYSQLAAYVAQVNAAAPCGLSNWRVPTVSEQLSLVDYAVATGAAADSFGFPQQQAARYWTSESVANASANAWFVDFSNQGVVSFDSKTSTIYTNYRVLLVSGTSIAPTACSSSDPQYVDNGDGTVSDAGTGLMWKQCEEGAQVPGCTGTKTAFSSDSQVLSQIAADNAANSPTGLGYTDWRLPTVKELASLANRSCSGTAVINTVAFPNADQLSVLSTTYYAPTSAWLWVVDFADGSISPVDPSTGGGRPIRLVRAGQ